MLDDIAFYSDALSAAQVQAHYNAFYQGLAPVISVQPASANLLVGSPFTMYAQAQGGQLAYQWYKNNTPIPGATSLTIGSASVAVTDTGVYYFTASNSVGVAWSSGAVLNVGNYIARYQAAVRSEPSLISYYTFDTSDATDSYGTNNGTAAGSGTITYTNGPGGVTNNSLVLNGSDWINLGQVSAFDFVSGGTAEAWIKTGWTSSWTTYGDAPCIFGDRDGGSVWDIHMDVGFHLIGNWNNDRFITLPVSNNASNTWHHYAVTFGGGLVSMYWDGQPLGTFNQAINFFCCETTQIGASDPSSPAQPWVGNLDEVAFYSSALSADAINNHYLAMVLPTPTISYSRSVSGITISWPLVYGTTYTLQSTASLSAPSWTPVGGVVSNSVTVTASPGSQFFRLVK